MNDKSKQAKGHGYKTVPVEPTPEMIQAGADSGGLGLDFHEWMGRIVCAWPKMIDAAPAVAVNAEAVRNAALEDAAAWLEKETCFDNPHAIAYAIRALRTAPPAESAQPTTWPHKFVEFGSGFRCTKCDMISQAGQELACLEEYDRPEEYAARGEIHPLAQPAQQSEPVGITEDERAAIEFYRQNPSAALFDFTKRITPSLEKTNGSWVNEPPVMPWDSAPQAAQAAPVDAEPFWFLAKYVGPDSQGSDWFSTGKSDWSRVKQHAVMPLYAKSDAAPSASKQGGNHGE